ncbi:MAG: hypothetical protein UY92_C0014G0003 [Candidatus Magasanikbacteria bacterium GW2011_GWA2_56_11]|uniref:PIN domain-containing protein n=1 Tax=Candidatus Magasanikbacteria bacterium GW2011_GWA2_56_11 TaxID=1619044 RepID=A0A0G1YDX7_9BACT|nr:MAG: hypothetical protein UY92_C0014G0003 [Candidatus Magasanikbacteria bacterium GW2011_GWA2_56_11]MBS3106563.1 type II toxin-antitoxin system VapC family toxin [Candidatus Woesearchaeota archaeon]
MTVLVDSWCWIEYFIDGKAAAAIEKYLNEGMVFISVINLAEVYKFAILNKSEADADKMVRWMLANSFVIPVDATIALNAAKFNAKQKLGLGDSLIYESAKAHKLKLVTGDPGFKGMRDVEYLGR